MTVVEPVDLTFVHAHTRYARDDPQSFVLYDTTSFWLERVQGQKRLAIVAGRDDVVLSNFEGVEEQFLSGRVIKLCGLTPGNAVALRRHLPWLTPAPLGLTTSAGFGDRLGLATPGHVRALQAVQGPGETIAPIFAQQSIREMQRTGRTPHDVMADATWGAFEAGWRHRLGADADHLKTTQDIDATVGAGYTFFTFDPSLHVDASAARRTGPDLRRRFSALPWTELQTTASDLIRRMIDLQIELEDEKLRLDEEAVIRASVKYGAAVAHVQRLYRHLEAHGVPFEIEISVDETETPTTLGEHVYLACELQRLGVSWVSLAPRFVGRFEKGIDFIGDLDELRRDFVRHAVVARALGPYKLSLHSGSDKFSVYHLIAEATRGAVHLKTAGTSYLEALRVVARLEPDVFRAVLAHGCEHYALERQSYHVSADPSRVPDPKTLRDDALCDLLEDSDVRQLLHVTFGSALARFGSAIRSVLQAHEEAYADGLERHFIRHLRPFMEGSTADRLDTA